MKKIVTFICALMTTVAVSASAELSRQDQELRANQQKAASTYVVEAGAKVAVAVDGLCCATCGIGVKKKIQKLDFVAKKGVEIDVDNSMAIISLKEANKMDQDAIVTAIRKAGYEPVSFYHWDGCCVKETVIAQEG